MNKLFDSNLFIQEFVPKRHKFRMAERNLAFRSPPQRKTLRDGGKHVNKNREI